MSRTYLPQGAKFSWVDDGGDLIFDRVLHRKLGLPRDHIGAYVEVGSGGPLLRSRTRLFHDRGWKGLNISLLSETTARFAEARPNDVSITAAIREAEGFAPVFLVDDGRFATATSDPDVAAHWRDRGAAIVQRQVECASLASLIGRRLGPIRPDIVNIEGPEGAAALETLDLTARMPRLIALDLVGDGVGDALGGAAARRLMAHRYRCVAFIGPTYVFARRD